MLHLPLKATENTNITDGLYRFVKMAYSVEQAEEHREVYNEISALRNKVRAVKHKEEDASESVKLLLRYYRLLCAMRIRFGTVVEDAEEWAPFTWKDAFKPSEKTSRPELNFEIACVLFNLAAALSYAASLENRATTSGLRAACASFQSAAGALEALAALLPLGDEHERGAEVTTDLHPRAVRAWRDLMLAQAQQCFYLKAVLDQVKPSVVAKLAAQVSTFYEEATASLQHAELRQKLTTWVATFEGQATLFRGWAQYHAAAEHANAHEYGSQVCRLSRATAILTALVKSANRQGPPPVLLAQAEAHEAIAKATAKAARENEQVYNERIPSIEALPPVEPKAIVKPTKLTELHPAELGPQQRADGRSEGGGTAGTSRGASRPGSPIYGSPTPIYAKGVEVGSSASAGSARGDPFYKLVPLAVLGDVSVFTAQRDHALRALGERREDAAQLASADLAEMDLPDALDAAAHEHLAAIPMPLAETLHALTLRGGAGWLREAIDDLADRAKDMESLANHIDATLEVEEGADRQLHLVHGSRWHALPSVQLNMDAREELSSLREKLATARHADGALNAALGARTDALEPLALPYEVLAEQVPRRPVSLAEEPCAKDVRALLQSLETTARAMDATLSEARAACEDGGALGERAITDALVYRGDGAGGSNVEVIAAHVALLMPYAERLSDQEAQQASLLGALRTSNEAFTRARVDDPTIDERQRYLERLDAVVGAFQEIDGMVAQGAAFYDQVEVALEALSTRVAGLAAARSLERSELLFHIQEEADVRRDESRAHEAAAQAAAQAAAAQAAAAKAAAAEAAAAEAAAEDDEFESPKSPLWAEVIEAEVDGLPTATAFTSFGAPPGRPPPPLAPGAEGEAPPSTSPDGSPRIGTWSRSLGCSSSQLTQDLLGHEASRPKQAVKRVSFRGVAPDAPARLPADEAMTRALRTAAAEATPSRAVDADGSQVPSEEEQLAWAMAQSQQGAPPRSPSPVNARAPPPPSASASEEEQLAWAMAQSAAEATQQQQLQRQEPEHQLELDRFPPPSLSLYAASRWARTSDLQDEARPPLATPSPAYPAPSAMVASAPHRAPPNVGAPPPPFQPPTSMAAYAAPPPVVHPMVAPPKPAAPLVPPVVPPTAPPSSAPNAMRTAAPPLTPPLAPPSLSAKATPFAAPPMFAESPGSARGFAPPTTFSPPPPTTFSSPQLTTFSPPPPRAAPAAALPPYQARPVPPPSASASEEEQLAWAMAQSQQGAPPRSPSPVNARAPPPPSASASEEEQLAWAMAQSAAEATQRAPPPVGAPLSRVPTAVSPAFSPVATSPRSTPPSYSPAAPPPAHVHLANPPPRAHKPPPPATTTTTTSFAPPPYTYSAPAPPPTYSPASAEGASEEAQLAWAMRESKSTTTPAITPPATTTAIRYGSAPTPAAPPSYGMVSSAVPGVTVPGVARPPPAYTMSAAASYASPPTYSQLASTSAPPAYASQLLSTPVPNTVPPVRPLTYAKPPAMPPPSANPTIHAPPAFTWG